MVNAFSIGYAILKNLGEEALAVFVSLVQNGLGLFAVDQILFDHAARKAPESRSTL